MKNFKQFQAKVEKGQEELNNIDEQLEKHYKKLLQRLTKNEKAGEDETNGVEDEAE
jgi:uncharacterized protein YecT (DUF1311 family)